MNRPLLASMAVGIGMACGVCGYALVPAVAQERGTANVGQTQSRTGAEQKHDQGAPDDQASERIDKALHTYQSYRDKKEPNTEQMCKQIEEMCGELKDLVKLRVDLAVSLAEIRADLEAAGMPVPSMPQLGYGMVMPGGLHGAGPAAQPNFGSQNQIPPEQLTKEEYRQFRKEYLARELKQLQDQLRQEIEQSQSHADHLVAEIRDLRSHQRQIKEQLRSSSQHQGESSKDSHSSQRSSSSRNQSSDGSQSK